MNLISRTLTGGLFLLLGVVLGYLSFTSGEGFWVLFIYGVLLMIIGIFILFNVREDEIEQIKTQSLKTKKAKKKRR